VKIITTILPSHRHVALLLACCGVGAFFFAVVNPAELGYMTSKNSLRFGVNPLHDPYLISSKNITMTGEPRYYCTPPSPDPGFLLYKLSAPYPFRYAVLNLEGWNNGHFSISVSHDGSKFTTVFPDPPQQGWVKTHVRLGKVVQGSSDLYLRVDVHGEIGKGQTNINSLQGNFILDSPISSSRILIGLGAGLAVVVGWWLYSKVLARFTGQPWYTFARTDIVAHWPLFILLLYLPLAHHVIANWGGALLFYAALGVAMMRLYHLIRLIPYVQLPGRLAGAVMLVALLTSVLVFYRGIIIDGDGIAYYMWANSILIDHDLDLANQAKDAVRLMNVPPEFELPRWPITGAVRHPYTTGTAFTQLPFAFLGHLTAQVLNQSGAAAPLDGYSLPYAVSVAAGSVIYTFAGFCLLLRVLWARYGAVIAMLTTLGMWFGTVILSMAYLHPSHSHGPDLLVTVVFFSVWYVQRERTACFSWVWRGTMLGLSMWVRQQNLVLVVLIAYDALLTGWRLWKTSPHWRISGRYVLTVGTGVALGLGVAYLPQIIYNLFTCGCVYYTGVEPLPLEWLTPQIGTVLFGGEHGLFYWTPIMLPAALGLGVLFREDRRLAGGLILVFAMTVYEIGILGVFGGAGAGQRYLINMTFPLAFGFAALMAYLSRRVSLDWLAAAVGGFIVLNVGLLSAYALGLIPEMGRGVVARDFLWAVLARGPSRIVEFLDGITYFNKPAFAIGATFFRAVVGGELDALQLVSGLFAFFMIGVFGGLISVWLLRAPVNR